MILKVLKRGTIFSIGTSLDMKWILIEKFREPSMFECEENLIEFLLEISKFGWNLDKRLIFAPSD
jgi:hypothetical protein